MHVGDEFDLARCLLIRHRRDLFAGPESLIRLDVVISQKLAVWWCTQACLVLTVVKRYEKNISPCFGFADVVFSRNFIPLSIPLLAS